MNTKIVTSLSRLRDTIAARLLHLGVTPNLLTVAGLLFAVAGSMALVMGAGHAPPWEAGRGGTPASWWPLLSGVLLLASYVLDLLDGAVARLGHLSTPFGALLDSTFDRYGDLFVLSGCVLHFTLSGNATYAALSLAAIAHAVLISYTKARAENFIENCSVGYWQRGERCGLFLLAAVVGHIPAVLWVLATLPLLTVVRRLRHAADGLRGRSRRMWFGQWFEPRGSPGHVGGLLVMMGWVIMGPLAWPWFYGADDPLRSAVSRRSGWPAATGVDAGRVVAEHVAAGRDDDSIHQHGASLRREASGCRNPGFHGRPVGGPCGRAVYSHDMSPQEES